MDKLIVFLEGLRPLCQHIGALILGMCFGAFLLAFGYSIAVLVMFIRACVKSRRIMLFGWIIRRSKDFKDLVDRTPITQRSSQLYASCLKTYRKRKFGIVVYRTI